MPLRKLGSTFEWFQVGIGEPRPRHDGSSAREEIVRDNITLAFVREARVLYLRTFAEFYEGS